MKIGIVMNVSPLDENHDCIWAQICGSCRIREFQALKGFQELYLKVGPVTQSESQRKKKQL